MIRPNPSRRRPMNEVHMTTLTASRARANLFRLLDQVSKNHEPISIKGKRVNGALVSEEDWRSIQETLYLVSIPGMRELCT